MTGDDFGQLIYLVLLLCVIGGYFLASGRKNLGANARAAMLWVFIFIGVIVVYGLWSDVESTVMSRQTVNAGAGQIEVPRRADGHFYLTLSIGDTPVEFIVDTGATDVVLSQEDAALVGLDPDTLIYGGRAFTANGTVRTAQVRLQDVTISGFDEGTVRASVNEGELFGSLLGMSYLERFESIEIRGDKLILTR
ncbi:MAG: TIGR02281 family clan AA aspartic protease [Pseudomonadota bacterium]